MSAQRTILCMKWGSKYGPEYINRLYGMVRRHLRGEFRFVCLTDQREGIRAEVQCLPIPDLALPAGIPERGWKKLTSFEADLHGLTGTALGWTVRYYLRRQADQLKRIARGGIRSTYGR